MSSTTANGPDDPNVQKAIEILSELAAIPPQHASIETVQGYAEAADLLADNAGSLLWFEACNSYASHLLEVPIGDKHENVMAARGVYADMLAQATPDHSFEEWFVASMGLGNTILFDPAASPEDYAHAAQFFDGVLPVVRDFATPVQLAKTLGFAAEAHSRAGLGDVDSALETAIRLQAEAIDVLTSLDEPDAIASLSVAHYSLGKYYSLRRVGSRSQNIDRAVHSLSAARDLRPAAQDPVGRARALRGLAVVLPEWSGADSLKHAAELAAAAEEEAALLANTDPREARRNTPHAQLERSGSALRENLDWLYEQPIEDRRAIIEGHIEFHRQMLQQIDRDNIPAVWAEWQAGLGRLCGRLAHIGASAAEMETAYNCFSSASECIDASDQPRLYRDIMACEGELSHEIGAFEPSFRAYRAAALASERILAEFDDPEHRAAEIENTRGFGLFGAYAAASLNRPEDAALLAEMERNRGIADLLGAKSALTEATPEERDEILTIFTRIQDIESNLRNLGEQDTDAEIEGIIGRLADYATIDPSLMQIRRTDDGAYNSDPLAAERSELRADLADQRRTLRALLVGPVKFAESMRLAQFGIDDIKSIATSANLALVYLISTVHGGFAIIVLPNGSVEALPLEQLSSDVTGQMVFGDEHRTGYRDAVISKFDEIDDCLAEIQDVLSATLMVPLLGYLRAHNVERAALIALGRLGILPLHITASSDVALSYAPSARALSANLPFGDRSTDGPALIIADPARDDTQPLKFAVAEGRWVADIASGGAKIEVLASEDATLSRVKMALPDSTILHFACHGQFRPADPLESLLALAGEENLILSDLFFGKVSASRARLATLSACDTGNVEFYRSSDEVTGFPTGLMLAGVPAVVSAMWSVDDAAAMLFMSRFYELVFEGEVDLAAAVTQAREWLKSASVEELLQRIDNIRATLMPQDGEVDQELQLLKNELRSYDKTGAPFSAPSDWGAFCLTGI